MHISVEVPEEAFRTPKTTEQVEAEIRQAAAFFWLARGEITPERAVTIARGDKENAQGFKDFLRSMPNVGDDADFERPLDYGRPVVEFD
jgi:hypothetical protein